MIRAKLIVFRIEANLFGCSESIVSLRCLKRNKFKGKKTRKNQQIASSDECHSHCIAYNRHFTRFTIVYIARAKTISIEICFQSFRFIHMRHFSKTIPLECRCLLIWWQKSSLFAGFVGLVLSLSGALNVQFVTILDTNSLPSICFELSYYMEEIDNSIGSFSIIFILFS